MSVKHVENVGKTCKKRREKIVAKTCRKRLKNF